ncbi:MAG: NAD(P)/FAD-dependent oxidoreductase [Chloroflexota bacterium]|nr:NAD(P)/FAD-dependent oxidoreductase [Chloroflexota bacterium]
MPHVVILGAGFGGLNAARTLGPYPIRITVVDRQNYHLFQPLLYQVATAGLSPGDIAEPIRAILRKYRNVRVLLDEAISIDLTQKQLTLGEVGELSYDYLIVATGSRHSYFGHEEWEALAPGLKSVDDALEIRRRILLAFEAAEREDDPEVRQAWLTFVLVGGGPTGVELAGAIAEIRRHTVAHDFSSIDPTQARIILIEAEHRLLSMFAEDLSARAENALRALGVEVRTGASVTAVTRDAVHVGNEVIPARTTLWAAGVAASPLGRSLGTRLDRNGRVAVEPDLTLPDHPDVYVIGDLAAFPHQTGRLLPGLAAVAMQQGRAAGTNVWRAIVGRPHTSFHYVDRGTMATIGRAAAVAQVGPIHLTGRIAWLAWLLVHLIMLIGFENRLLVLLEWLWSYCTYQRGSRLITGPSPLAQPSSAEPIGQATSRSS